MPLGLYSVHRIGLHIRSLIFKTFKILEFGTLYSGITNFATGGAAVTFTLIVASVVATRMVCLFRLGNPSSPDPSARHARITSVLDTLHRSSLLYYVDV